MAKAAPPAAHIPLKRGARILLAESWRLQFIVPGAVETDPDLLEVVVRSQKAVMRTLGQCGHHDYDANQLLALRQAYVALRTKRLRERHAGVASKRPETDTAADEA